MKTKTNALLLLTFISITLFSCDFSEYTKIAPQKPFNIDSLCAVIKNSQDFEIKEVFYNKTDSSLNIAITNKDNVIKEKVYNTYYFKKNYNTDSIDAIDGVTIYAYNKKLSLKKGTYPDYLVTSSKRARALQEKFIEKHCYSGKDCYPLSRYLKEHMNDPDSFEPADYSIEWNGGKTFLITQSYRGKNAFGGLVLNKCSAVVDMAGNVSEVQQL